MNWPKFLIEDRPPQLDPRDATIRRLARDLRALRRARDGFKSADRDRLTADWPTAPTAITDRLARDLTQLRAVSRKQAVDNPYAKRFLQLCWNNIIGPNGLTLQSLATNPDETGLDDFLNAAVEDSWRRWGARPRNCDHEERLTWFDFERLVVTGTAEDGEAFLRLVRGRGEGPFGFRLQFIDPQLIDISHNFEFPDGRRVRGGIEYDRFGRVIAYHVGQTGRTTGLYSGNSYVRTAPPLRVPAEQMIHVFFPEKVGQLRGIPWMAASLYRLSMIEGYDDAAMVAARWGASSALFFQGEEYGGDDLDEELSTETDAEHVAQVLEIEPGVAKQLPLGTTLETYDPSYPHEQYDPFQERALRGAASGLGVGYEGLANDRKGVNFSSIRAGRMEDIDDWKHRQRWLRTALHDPVFGAFVPAAMLTGQLRVAGRVPSDRRDKIVDGARWIPRVWDLVEPLKDTQRAVLEIQNQLRSRSEYIRTTYARDPDEVFAEIEFENVRWGVGAGLAGALVDQIPEDDDEDGGRP